MNKPEITNRIKELLVTDIQHNKWMDEVMKMAKSAGNQTGKAVNMIAAKANEAQLPDKFAKKQKEITTAVTEKYSENTGRPMETDLKIATAAGGAYAAVCVAAMAPTIVLAGAGGAAAYAAAVNSNAAKTAKETYQTKLGRDFDADKEAAKNGVKKGVNTAVKIGKAAQEGYEEARPSVAKK